MTFPTKPSQKRLVYLDHAAATPLDPKVFEVMKPYFGGAFGNPSSLYKLGREARRTVENARQEIGVVLDTQPDTLIFTSGGTEANTLALAGAARHAFATNRHARHIVTTQTEHHAVLEICHQLEREGFDVTYLPVDEEGFVTVKQVHDALREDTILVSIMYANNEIGTVQPIEDIGREILKWRKAHGGSKEKVSYPYFHVDACQAPQYLELDVEKLHVDLMSLNGSKIYGPKGVGLLYRRREVALDPIVHGGGQEFGLRSGTENVPGIVGLAAALTLRRQEVQKERESMICLAEYAWKRILKEIPDCKLNGPEIGERRLANNLNIIFSGVEAEALVLYLDEYGIAVGTGSACAAGSDQGSHVLCALGRTQDEIRGSIRLSFGKDTTKDDIDYVMRYLPAVVEELRRVSHI